MATDDSNRDLPGADHPSEDHTGPRDAPSPPRKKEGGVGRGSSGPDQQQANNQRGGSFGGPVRPGEGSGQVDKDPKADY